MREWFVAESQDNPHHWAATFAGHCYLMMGPWGIVAIGTDKWTAAWVVPLLYLLVWEGTQWILSENKTKQLAWDCILDTVAVAFGCYAAALGTAGYMIEGIMCWGASIGVAASGYCKRR